jgi:site-specific DNA recombinase
VDLSTEQGVLVAGIKAQVGRYESQQNSRRVLRKQRELREAGKPFSGGIRSYGYDTDRTTLIQVEAEEIRRMVRLLLSGHSVGHIVRDLNERSVPTVSQWMAAQPRKGDRATIVGKPWGRTSVRTLLERPRLAGLLTYRGEVVGPGQWEPILDQETFRRVQVALSQRRPHQAPPFRTGQIPRRAAHARRVQAQAEGGGA